MSYLRHAILPALGGLRVDAITRADVARQFHESGRRSAGGANRVHDSLRDMFARAVAWGHRPESAGNPCSGIERYRRPPRGRLLGKDDLARLGAVLRRLEREWTVKVAAVRLILPTGVPLGRGAALAMARREPRPARASREQDGTEAHVLLGGAA